LIAAGDFVIRHSSIVNRHYFALRYSLFTIRNARRIGHPPGAVGADQ